MVTARVSWGVGLNGRDPTQEDSKSLLGLFKAGLRGPFTKGRAGAGLRNFLSFGHRCDLTLVAASRVLKAVDRWQSARSRERQQVSWAPSFRSRTQKLLGKWSWSALPHGATNGTEVFRFGTPKPTQDKALHALRADWRAARPRTGSGLCASTPIWPGTNNW